MNKSTADDNTISTSVNSVTASLPNIVPMIFSKLRIRGAR